MQHASYDQRRLSVLKDLSSVEEFHVKVFRLGPFGVCWFCRKKGAVPFVLKGFTLLDE